jgi:hypothetical protein
MDLNDVICVDESWIHLAQDRNQWLDVMNTAVNCEFSESAVINHRSSMVNSFTACFPLHCVRDAAV